MDDEPNYTSIRVDAETYADRVTPGLPYIGMSERQCGLVREKIVAAFEEGEHQSLCRALLILGIARRKAADTATRAALQEAIFLLAPDLRDDEASESATG